MGRDPQKPRRSAGFRGVWLAPGVRLRKVLAAS